MALDTAQAHTNDPVDDMPLVSVRDLATHFFSDEGVVRAVDGVSFDVQPGRILGVVGETGCGKSVLTRSVLGIVDKPGRVVNGEVLLRTNGDWLNLAKLPPDGRQMRSIRGGEIGLVFQEPMTSFSPVHTVGDQLIEAVRLHEALDKHAAHDRAVELLSSVGVPRPDGYMKAYAWQLSGGLRQRSMIAMALAGRPRLLIADEPTTALDVITQAHILRLIRHLQDDANVAIMLITHDLGVIAQMADDVVVMYLGRVVEKGPVDRIFHDPQHPYTRALLKSIPSADAPRRGRLATISGSVPHPLERPGGCSFHPRCPSSVAGLCDEQPPPRRTVENGHEVECHLDSTELVAANLHFGQPVDQERTTAAVTTVSPTTDPAHAVAEPHRVTLLEVKNLNKAFPIKAGALGRARGSLQAVDDVSFELYPGETLALVGESGSGKTTVSRCVMRSHEPDSGEILYRTDGDRTIDLATLGKKALRGIRSDLQMIFQDPYSSLNPRMTVGDIISEPLLVHGIGTRRERIERVEELLGLVGLRPEYMQRYPHAFSGGQRQRIGIARALSLSPRLIVADEPVSALDVSVQAQTLNLLLDLQERLGLTYLFVSHDLGVVGHISDRIAVMYAGQIVELGTHDAVLESPKHPYTAALLEAVPSPDPRQRSALEPPTGPVANLADPPSGCYFHTRCRFAVDRCKIERPELDETSPAHHVRCHRSAELTLKGVSADRGTTLPLVARAEEAL